LIGKGKLFPIVWSLYFKAGARSHLALLNRQVTENYVVYSFFSLNCCCTYRTEIKSPTEDSSHLTGEGIPQVLKSWRNPSSNSTNTMTKKGVSVLI